MELKDNPDALRALLRERISRSIELKEALLNDERFQGLVAQVALRIVKSLGLGGKVFFFGKEVALRMRNI